MHNIALEKLINQKLNSYAVKDYSPNGLQVEGCPYVKRIVTGVTACQALLDAALELQADAVIVHHGYFWEKESPVIVGIKKTRLKILLMNNINLYAWHLPLDIHPELSNNVNLATTLGIRITDALAPMVLQGQFDVPLSGIALRLLLEEKLGRCVLHCSDNAPKQITRLAWCTGRGQNFIEQAAHNGLGLDAFISGEVSENTIHIAREIGMHFYAAGHHATERYGIRALGEWLSQQHNFHVTFIDIPNPA